MIIPPPTYKEEDEPFVSKEPDFEWIGEYWRVPDWKCTHCHAVMFGRMSYCIYCKVRLGRHTPKPTVDCT